MTKGSRMVGAVIGATLAVAATWYILNHQAGIKSWFQNLGKSLAPTPSAPTTGSTPPTTTAHPAAGPTTTPKPVTSVPIVHPTYPDDTWNPRTEKIVAGTITPVDAANLPKSTTTNKIHPTTHTPSPPPVVHSHPLIPAPHPVTVHHTTPPLQKTSKTPKQTRHGVACTNPKSCNGTSCCHVKCEDIDTCYGPCGWSKDDYNRFMASCINAVNVVTKK